MVTLKALVDYTNTLLSADSFTDYCPNGLQVEGRADVKRLVSGVTASQALIDAAVGKQADAIVVHHGFFWKGEDACITGMKRTRLQSLLGNDISLLAYHLPLDAHPELGNNAQLGVQLGIEPQGVFGHDGGLSLAQFGVLTQPLSAAALCERIEQRLGRAPMHIPGDPAEIRRVGWCTGAAQSYIEAAVEQGLDAYISGEISEQTVHIARESGIHYIAAGHHATERYGVKALGEYLAGQFSLEHHFIDIDNPV
jgi:dinuclear metal center YbgI/SA1388 family protein